MVIQKFRFGDTFRFGDITYSSDHPAPLGLGPDASVTINLRVIKYYAFLIISLLIFEHINAKQKREIVGPIIPCFHPDQHYNEL